MRRVMVLYLLYLINCKRFEFIVKTYTKPILNHDAICCSRRYSIRPVGFGAGCWVKGRSYHGTLPDDGPVVLEGTLIVHVQRHLGRA